MIQLLKMGMPAPDGNFSRLVTNQRFGTGRKSGADVSVAALDSSGACVLRAGKPAC
jgi:hypothetical protein